MSGDHA
jgi:hypothetical protein